MSTLIPRRPIVAATRAVVPVPPNGSKMMAGLVGAMGLGQPQA